MKMHVVCITFMTLISMNMFGARLDKQQQPSSPASAAQQLQHQKNLKDKAQGNNEQRTKLVHYDNDNDDDDYNNLSASGVWVPKQPSDSSTDTADDSPRRASTQNPSSNPLLNPSSSASSSSTGSGLSSYIPSSSTPPTNDTSPRGSAQHGASLDASPINDPFKDPTLRCRCPRGNHTRHCQQQSTKSGSLSGSNNSNASSHAPQPRSTTNMAPAAQESNFIQDFIRRAKRLWGHDYDQESTLVVMKPSEAIDFQGHLNTLAAQIASSRPKNVVDINTNLNPLIHDIVDRNELPLTTTQRRTVNTLLIGTAIASTLTTATITWLALRNKKSAK